MHTRPGLALDHNQLAEASYPPSSLTPHKLASHMEKRRVSQVQRPPASQSEWTGLRGGTGPGGRALWLGREAGGTSELPLPTHSPGLPSARALSPAGPRGFTASRPGGRRWRPEAMWVSGRHPSPTPPVPGVGSSWGVGPRDAASGRASWASGWPSQPLVGFVPLGSRWGSVGSGCAELSHERCPLCARGRPL